MQKNKIVKYTLLSMILAFGLSAYRVLPVQAAGGDTVYNVFDFRTAANGRQSATNGPGTFDPATFRDLSGAGILAPSVINGALQGEPSDSYNVAAVTTQGDGRLTALFAGEVGVHGDADNRWGLEWFNFGNSGGGYRMQVRPDWTEIRVEQLGDTGSGFGVVQTLQTITLEKPLVPNVDRVGFERDGGTWRVYVNNKQVSADLYDVDIAVFTDVVIGVPSPTHNTFPRWAWWAYTSGSDFILNDVNSPNNGDTNGDGINDNTQTNVTAIKNSTTNKFISLESSNGCTNTRLGGVAETDLVDDAKYSYPLGLLNFTIECPNPGDTSTINIYYYGSDGLAVLPRKLINGQYSNISGVTLTNMTIGGQSVAKVSYQITDGGVNDEDGVANGFIVDPIGLAKSDTQNSQNAQENLADTGENTAWLASLGGGLIVFGSVGFWQFYTHKSRRVIRG